jgi:hypothetical protein
VTPIKSANLQGGIIIFRALVISDVSNTMDFTTSWRFVTKLTSTCNIISANIGVTATTGKREMFFPYLIKHCDVREN